MSQLANAEISVTWENTTSFEPGFVLSPFFRKDYFPGPILIPWALWIEIDLQTLNEIDVTVHQFFSQRMVVGLIGTRCVV